MGSKRKYISPKIEIHHIDQEICLVMESPPGDPTSAGGMPPEEGPSRSAPEYQSTLNEETPFGGQTPNYDNM